MEKVSGLPVRRVGVLTALIALVASLLVVPAQQMAFGATLDAETCVTGTNPTFNGGNGSSGEPFLISSAGNLETLVNCLPQSRGSSTDFNYNAATVYYKQTANIDWVDNKPIGSSTRSFRANYDGSGFAVSGFQQSGSGDRKGLFAEGFDCSVSNLTVSGNITSSTSNSRIGLVMGNSTGCEFDNVTAFGVVTSASTGYAGGVLGGASSSTVLTNVTSHVDLIVTNTSSAAGGIIGNASDTVLTDVEISPQPDPHDDDTMRGRMEISNGRTTATQRGGAVGYMSDTTLTRAAVSIPIVGTWSHSVGNYLGGLVGEARLGVGGKGAIADSTFSGSITVDNASTSVRLGGLVAWLHELPLSNSQSSGDLTIKMLGGGSSTEVGGAVGFMSNGGTMTRVSSTGTFAITTDSSGTARTLGGLVGRLSDGEIAESYAKVDATGFTQARFGALVGSSNGTGLPKISDSFAFGTIEASGDAVSRVSGLVAWFGTGQADTTEAGTTVDNLYTFVNVGSGGYAVNVVGGTFGATGSPIYWNSTQSGTSSASGGTLHRDNPPEIKELTSTEFIDPDEFPGWDFNSTWTMGDCAPYLTWMGSSPRGLCPAVVPDAPELNTVTAGDSQLTIAFTQGFDGGDEIIDYKYSLNGGAPVALNLTTVSSPVTITGLSNGTTYSVTLMAVNGVGASLASNSLSGTPVVPAPPPSDPVSDPAPTTAPKPAPTPAQDPEQDPAPTPAPRPASAPTPAVEPPVASNPVRPTPTPTPPPAADPAPAAETPAGPGALVLRAEEVFEGTIFMGTDTEELIMPAFVLQDIATRLAPDGAPLDEGALVIESGRAMIPVLLIQLGDVRLAAADMGDTIQFTLNIPGFESSSMSVAVQKQALMWAFWAQLALVSIAAVVAMIFAWWFFIVMGRRKNRVRAGVNGLG